ncbi:hypothetical protein H0H81_007995 [Sphagnurus paluster]|uniref:Uncharacterized protein n=1 Tax=Sphagnurus paluster TaxID=117069 RepID=A0A9P7FUD9_9AGAR|nr:hypothetical protein H0H81_007995 [Sphagnurus paluster]
MSKTFGSGDIDRRPRAYSHLPGFRVRPRAGGIMISLRTNTPRRAPRPTLSLKNFSCSLTTNPMHSPAAQPHHPVARAASGQYPDLYLDALTGGRPDRPPEREDGQRNDTLLTLFASRMLIGPENAPVPTAKKG